MGIATEKHIRKPLYVDAVRITTANFDEIVAWCQGEVQEDPDSKKKYIKVRVHNPKNPRQTKAFVGDWLLYTERGYKVYTNKAFHASFDKAQMASTEQLEKAFGAKAKVRKKQAEGEIETNGAAITQVELHSVGPVTATPEPGNGIGEITSVTPVEDETSNQLEEYEPPAIKELPSSPEMTIETEGGTVEEATPQGIADAVQQNEAAREGAVIIDAPPEIADRPGSIQNTSTVEDVEPQESIVPAAAEGRRVLSVEEQASMDADEVRELIRSGEAVLAQDLA